MNQSHRSTRVASTGENNYSSLEAMTRERDEQFMRAALNEAKKALGQTSPNPAVGAVLGIDDRIVARGHHREAGLDHAEIECLRDFGARVPGRATLYVTLEPCSTAGRTAPCTDARSEERRVGKECKSRWTGQAER